MNLLWVWDWQQLRCTDFIIHCQLFYPYYLLIPLEIEYLKTLSFILVIAVTVQVTELILYKTSPLLYQGLGDIFTLITTNCAVLMSLYCFNIQQIKQSALSLLFWFECPIGFTLVLVLFLQFVSDWKWQMCLNPSKGTIDCFDNCRNYVFSIYGVWRNGEINGLSHQFINHFSHIVIFGILVMWVSKNSRSKAIRIVEQINAILPQTINAVSVVILVANLCNSNAGGEAPIINAHRR